MIHYYQQIISLCTEIQTLGNPGLESGRVKSAIYGQSAIGTMGSQSREQGITSTELEYRVSVCSTGGPASTTLPAITRPEVEPTLLLLPPLITHTAATPQGSPPSSALDTVPPPFYVADDDESSEGSDDHRPKDSSSVPCSANQSLVSL